MKKGFTLAEVLITLGIIGIISAMTLPTIIQKQNDKITVTKLKKMYSVLSQAYLFAVSESGTPDTWGFGNRDAGAEEGNEADYIASNALIMKNILFKQFKNMHVCDKAVEKKSCGIAETYYYENGSVVGEFDSKVSGLSMIDGSSVLILVNSGACNEVRGTDKYLKNVCGWIFLDINNLKSPNTIGRDVFGFYLTKYGIVPEGSANETRYNINTSNGHGKTAWVIFNENLDYLRCPGELSWNGKKSCNQ